MTEEQTIEFRQEIMAACEKHGVVDFFFAGVPIDDNRGFSFWEIGAEGESVSNTDRTDRMTGFIGRLLIRMQANIEEDDITPGAIP